MDSDFCKIFILLTLMTGVQCCKSTSNPISDRWKDTGVYGWNNLKSPDGALTKVLVGMGTGIKKLVNFEVIDLASNETDCQGLPNFPHYTLKAVGGLLLNYSSPVVCADISTSPLEFQTTCFSYLAGHHHWHHYERMSVSKGPMSGATIYQDDGEESGGLLLTGGFTNTQQHNVDLLTFSNGLLSLLPLAPEMPIARIGHCAVPLNSTTVMIIGGHNIVHRELKSVLFYHVDRQEWVQGPSLNFARHKHACALMKNVSPVSVGGKFESSTAVIIAGGLGEFDQPLKSVELLEEGGDHWSLGPELPTPIRDSVMISDQTGSPVIIGGMSPDAYYLGQSYRLATLEDNWSDIGVRLKIPRNGHIAFKIPDQLTFCRLKNETRANASRRFSTNRRRTYPYDQY